MDKILRGVFTATLTFGAFGLFLVQPMVGKMLLPILGGTPAIWNTCMVFFQAALLAGYLWSHLAAKLLPLRGQLIVQLGLILLPLITLPLGLADHTLADIPTRSPQFWLLGVLAATVGPTFVMVSTTSPLLQKWFSYTTHPDADHPYFLYAASNVGSVTALVLYPVVIERVIALDAQRISWSIGYSVWVVGMIACAIATWRWRADAEAASGAEAAAPARHEGPTWRRRLRWTGLALVPSSLMLGVTHYVSVDVAPLPLLWVIPLALYLLTFILVFARTPRRAPAWVGRRMCLVAVFLIVVIGVGATYPMWLFVLAHFATFFAAAYVCHSRLADDAPEAEHLTEFYAFMSLGGVLGGILNALIAPLIFEGLWEYPLMLAVACMLRRPAPDEQEGKQTSERTRRVLDVTWPLLVLGVGVANIWAVQALGWADSPFAVPLSLALPAVLTLSPIEFPRRFGLSLIALLLATMTFTGPAGEPLHTERNFFGTLRVTRDLSGRFRLMMHGSTEHGRQHMQERPSGCTPLLYYWRRGPIGEVFTRVATDARDVAVVGLGTGALACYATSEQKWWFYEIDPKVVDIATDPDYFTLLDRSRADTITHVIGDARVQLADRPDDSLDILVLDAFSSDAIPTHLLTREAFALYLRKLREDGVIAIHISNRVFDLRAPIARLASTFGLSWRYRHDDETMQRYRSEGVSASEWMVLARSPDALGVLAQDDARWTTPEPAPAAQLWRDDFVDLLRTVRW